MDTLEILKKYKPTRDNLLNILHEIQDKNPRQYIPVEAMDHVAKYLNMTKSSIYGVVEYYSMLSRTPRGRYIIRVCISPVCQMFKYQHIISSLENELGIEAGQTTNDNLFTLEVAECLGQCHEAPSMMINQKVFNNLTPQSIPQIIDIYRQNQ